jgi:D-lactate dehydrogenase (cytochrome)
MTDETGAMKWWGWGDPAREIDLPEAALSRLRAGLGAEARKAKPVELAAVELTEPRLTGKPVERLAGLVGPEWVRQDRLSRVEHAAGKGYADLVRLRAGHAEQAPDAVVYPETAAEVRDVLTLCAESGIAVVPFGGGTSVVGGVEPVRDSFGALISLDLTRMENVEVDSRSLTAKLGPGLRGPQVEAALSRSDLTLGHFPQSFEYATVGGWVATRSAGQASTGFGKIEEMVVGLECMSPSGEIDVKALPATAAGPQLRELLVGSEGTLGVITELTLRLHPIPDHVIVARAAFPSVEAACRAAAAMIGVGVLVTRCELLDATTIAALNAYAGTSFPESPHLFVEFGGTEAGVAGDLATTQELAEDEGALTFESESDPTARSQMWSARHSALHASLALAPGSKAMTTDVAVPVSELAAAIEHARRALDASALRGGIVGHAGDGNFHVAFLLDPDDAGSLAEAKALNAALVDDALGRGGTCTGEHGIGFGKLDYLEQEHGDLLPLMRGIKELLDPNGIMNPGKVVPYDAAPA